MRASQGFVASAALADRADLAQPPNTNRLRLAQHNRLERLRDGGGLCLDAERPARAVEQALVELQGFSSACRWRPRPAPPALPASWSSCGLYGQSPTCTR